MFSIFSRKSQSAKDAFAFIGLDIHNHLLPGIDDGSPDVETSLHLIEGLVDLGFERFVCTPHILSDLYPNTRDSIGDAYTLMKPLLAEKFASLQLGFAAEYMVDYDFEKLIKPESLLSFGKENHVLIEMSYLVESPNLKVVIFNLLTKGYSPILAHPERYGYYHHRFSVYQDLFDAGCSFQINLLSLGGYYGKNIRLAAEKLIDKELVNWVGTDTHHINHLEGLQQLAKDKKALKSLDKIKHLWNRDIVMG